MNCCNNKTNEKRKKGFISGLIYGLIPHIGCIAFILFSVLGVTTATAIFKPLLLNPYFFHILVAISIVFATISAFFYLKKQGVIGMIRREKGVEINFSARGIKRKWKYLLTLYGTTISINLLLFMVIFPIAANLNSGTTLTAAIKGAFGRGGELELSDSESLITLKVEIPCPGHAPLIIEELKKIYGVGTVKFTFPNLFVLDYDKEKTTKEKILSLDVFNTYKVEVVNEKFGQESFQSRNNNKSSSASACCGIENCGCGCGR